jgi:hypothetical protein
LAKSPDGQLVAVVEDKEPLEFLAVTDLATGESWPGGPDDERWDEGYRQRARLINRLQAGRGDLQIIKGDRLFQTVNLDSALRLLIWARDYQGGGRDWLYQVVKNDQEIVRKTFFGPVWVENEEPFDVLKSPNGEMLAIYREEKPEKILVLCDLSDGTHWPCAADNQNELNLLQGRLLFKLKALSRQHQFEIPNLRLARVKVEGLLEVELCLMHSSKAAPGHAMIRLSSMVSFDDVKAALKSDLLGTTGTLCTFSVAFDPARKDIFDFSTFFSEDRKVIAVIHVSDPDTVLAMHDFRTGMSWPGTMSVEERDTLLRNIRNRPSGEQQP